MFTITFNNYSYSKSEFVSSPNPLLNDDDHPKRNEATWAATLSKEKAKAWLINLKIYIGHTESQCGGKCVKIFGHYMHLDCRGFGNECKHYFNSVLIAGSVENEYQLLITDNHALGEYLDFHFPQKLLFITNPKNSNELWLNIPEQFLSRDSHDEPFIINNVWFSEEPELENS